MVGLNPEFAHETMSGLSFHHAVAQTLWHGKLFHIDLNAQRIGKYDQDFRFGSEGIRDAFYLVRLLEDVGLGRHAPLRRARLPHRGRRRRVGLRAGLHAHLPDPARRRRAASTTTPRSGRRSGRQADRLGEPRCRAAPPEGIAVVRAEVAGYDEAALGSQGYGHERLDQLVTELLLGVR